MVLLKILMEISLPKMGELLVMMMTMISPSGREVPLAELLECGPRRAPPLIFFLGQNDLYTRRGASEVDLGEHNPPGRAWAPWRAQVGCAQLVGPLWYLFAPIFLKYSINFPRKVSAHLEMCKIGSLTWLFQVQISICQNSPPLCIPCIL